MVPNRQFFGHNGSSYLILLEETLGLFDSHLIEPVMMAAPIILIAYLVRGICGFGSGVAAGLFIFHNADADLLPRFLGGFVFLYALYVLWGPEMPRASSWWAVPAAVSGGTIGTLFGTGGPFYVSYLKARQLDKTAFRATFACIFLLDGTARVTGYLGTSVIDIQLLVLLAMSLPVMILGMYLGGKINTNLSAEVFTRAISIMLLACGASLVLR